MDAGSAQGAVDGRVSGPRSGAVGAEQGHHVSGLGVRREKAGLRPTGATGRHSGAEAVSVSLGEPSDRESVGDAPYAPDNMLIGPVAASRLQYPRFERVGDQEAVVVGEGAILVAAAAALAVALEEVHEHGDRCRCRGRAFQSQPQEIHPRQTCRCVGLACEQRFVADDHPVLIGPHLRSPHPVRAAQQNAVGLGRLGDLDPRATHRCALRVRRPPVPLQELRLVGVAVGVLSEQHPLLTNRHHAIAHHF